MTRGTNLRSALSYTYHALFLRIVMDSFLHKLLVQILRMNASAP